MIWDILGCILVAYLLCGEPREEIMTLDILGWILVVYGIATGQLGYVLAGVLFLMD